MRLSKVLDLDDKRQIILRELRVSDVYSFMDRRGDFEGFDGMALTDLAKLDGFLRFMGDCVELVDCPAASLSFSEILAAFAAFKEVNAAFLTLLAKAGINLDLVMETPENSGANLDGPAAPSSSAGTDGSLNTAGASS